ncbi:antitoxin Xre/MbcA/ParS toxin-binding domain-containing protein [Flagellimonas olearia]|uniref:Uncharacterized protein n=1 Tax=Flagellimonas olearia TaxID=552546 RepID=A0A444VI12_9FLAO|nr:antitoxin Xre/MbcA/ParS toxin-binding domain-containing protein [Allomuricauda olearia]RYC50407.1 hypothetical protein DN53_05665 [Allomuricauda olearia]
MEKKTTTKQGKSADKGSDSPSPRTGSRSRKAPKARHRGTKAAALKSANLEALEKPQDARYGLLIAQPQLEALPGDFATFDWNDDYRGHALVRVIRHGIDYGVFEKMAEPMPFEQEAWATILNTTTRTLDRYKKEHRSFKSQQTERIIEIKQLYQKGVDVFGDKDNFDAWLETENLSLGRIRPVSLLDTSVGIHMVKDELGRIEHGILA